MSICAVVAAAISGLLVVQRIELEPRTSDAEVIANYIGMAPVVEGPIVKLAVHDNQLVQQGQLLFEIDDAPYEYALENAKSQQAALEGTSREPGQAYLFAVERRDGGCRGDAQCRCEPAAVTRDDQPDASRCGAFGRQRKSRR